MEKDKIEKEIQAHAKPCPFCGGRNLRYISGYVECDDNDCGTFGPTGCDFDEALEKWNQRSDT